MALRLPQSASLPPIQYKGRKVPVDQIIQIMGQNPLAAGLDSATQSIAAALEKRNQLRKQAAQMAQVEAQTGLAAGSLTGLPLDTGVALAKMKGDATSEAAKAQATAQDKAADRAFKERQQTDLTKFRGQLLQTARSKAAVEKPPTSEQSKAGTFAARALQAERDLGALTQAGFKMQTGFTTKLPEMVKPAQTKQFQQAEANFISAVLRKESGAAIPPEEYAAESRKYFPKPGDDPRTLQQKQMARLIAIRGLQNEAKGQRPEIDAPDVGSLQTLLNVGAAGGVRVLAIEPTD